MKIDSSKTPLQNIVALVDLSNNDLDITAADITAGIPAVVTGDINFNTSVELTATGADNYTGSVEIKYRRLTLNEGLANPPTSTTVSSSTTESQFLDLMASLFKLVRSEIQMVGTYNPGSSGESGDQTFRAIDNSLLYLGQQAINVTWS